MQRNFKDISYLAAGNCLQKNVFKILHQHQILQVFANYNPLVVGTIPINIAIASSDVDILLQTDDLPTLQSLFDTRLSCYPDYQLSVISSDTLVCNCTIENTPFEFYAANQSTDQQYGYLHMLKEYEILTSKGEDFRQQVVQLKQTGIKTEAAFCQLLGIEGNPYIELLKYNV